MFSVMELYDQTINIFVCVIQKSSGFLFLRLKRAEQHADDVVTLDIIISTVF